MRRLLVGIAVAAAVGLGIAAAAGGGAPQISIGQPRHEFAPVPEGAEVSHDFIIQNRGGSDLEIQKVETG